MRELSSHLNIRASKQLLSTIQSKARDNGITKSLLVRIAIENVSDDDILEHLLKKNIGYKKPQ